MKKEEIFEYVNKKYKTMPEYLFKNPNDAIIRNKNNKWYGVIMNIKKQKLGIEQDGSVNIINVKCVPDMIGSLRLEKGFFPAYHMNKEHWITIVLDDDSISKEKIMYLIDLSYELTK